MVTNIERFASKIEETSTDPNFQKGAKLLRAYARRLGTQGLLPREIVSPTESTIEKKSRYIHPLFEYDPNEHTLQIEGVKKELRPTIIPILDYFIQNAGRAVPRGILYQLVDPSMESVSVDNLLKVSINMLRAQIARGRKIESPIISVRSVGYAFRGPEYVTLQPVENPFETNGIVWERNPSALK